jgi:hypothetical protein
MSWKLSAPVRGEEFGGAGVHRDVGELASPLERDRNCHGCVTKIRKVFKVFRRTIEI